MARLLRSRAAGGVSRDRQPVLLGGRMAGVADVFERFCEIGAQRLLGTARTALIEHDQIAAAE